MSAPLSPLPIDGVMAELLAAMRAHPAVVLEAPPGAGKTTRVPRALLDAGFASGGEILVLEPRRLATRLSAVRVAQELGEPIGQRVGYQVRFEDVSSPATRVRFVTEGLLTRRLLTDPQLRGVSVVLLDEFHERHVHTDLALGLLTRLQRTSRPELKLCVMSATIETNALAEFLGKGGAPAPVIRSAGKRFDVALDHLPRDDDRPLGELVARAVRTACKDGLDGDVLVFLPGAAEIRRAAAALTEVAKDEGLLVVTLHGDMTAAEQDEAVATGRGQRKVILSTNVAETSVTLPGVVCVIDSGLARVASYAPWSGLQSLRTQRISQASAKQRAGRAGRVRAGRCMRLYTSQDHATRAAFDTPELLRVDLSETLLLLHGLGASLRGPAALPLLDRPADSAVDAAEALLGRLRALDGEQLTPLGVMMSKVAAHPRLSRLMLHAAQAGHGRAGATLAALLSEQQAARRVDVRRSVHESDLTAWFEAFSRAEADGFSARAIEAAGFDIGGAHAVRKLRDQLLRALPKAAPTRDVFDVLAEAQLVAFVDRLAKRRAAHSPEVVFALRGSGELVKESAAHAAQWLVAVDAEERVTGTQRRTLVRLACAVDVNVLIEQFIDAIDDGVELVWNDKAERVDAYRRMRFEGLVIEEQPELSPPPEQVARVLAEAVRKRGVGQLIDAAEFEALRGRIAFLAEHCPELGLRPLDDTNLALVLQQACIGARSFADLRSGGLLHALASACGPDAARLLDEHAPERVTLPGGRRAPISYVAGQPPSVASRLQDFFGMARGPTLGKGRVPLVIHLLAPNGRDVQVTTDLAGFWQRHYPAIAKELRRRYPRHKWPDDPLTAEPPAPRR